MTTARLSTAITVWLLGWAAVANIIGMRSSLAADTGQTAITGLPKQAVPAGWSNRRITKTAACTATADDTGGTLALGGNAFYRLSFDVAEQYPPTFAVVVLNEDRGRAKFIALANGESFYLWPQQSVIVFNQNNSWQTMGRAKWLLPTGPLALHADFDQGSDEYGKSDGLATGVGALRTVNHALYFANNQFCWNPDGDTPGPGHGLQTRLTVLMAPGSTDTTPVHYAMHGILGAQGGDALVLDLNGGKLTSNGKEPAILVGLNSFLLIRNGTLSAPNSTAIDVVYGGKVYLRDNLTFGAIGAGCAHVRLLPGSFVRFVRDYTIAAGNPGGYHIMNVNGTLHHAGPITVTIADDVSFLHTYCGNGLSYGAVGGLSVNLNGHTVTTKAPVNLDGNSVLYGAAKVPGTGTITVTRGGQAL